MAVAIRKTAALALAGGLIFAGAGTAALETNLPHAEAQVQGAGTIDFNKTGSLTVNKYLNNTSAPLQGVEFTVTRLEFDLKKPEDFAKASKMSRDELAKAPAAKGDGAFTKTMTTDSTGKAKFSELPLGVYRVSETNVTGAKDLQGKPVPNVVPGVDFAVFIPTTNEAGTGWEYDVQVSPKNSSTTTTKEVKDADKNVGDEVEYAIKATAPAVPANEKLTSYAIQDAYNSKELDNVTVKSVTVGGTPLVEGTDYNVTRSPATAGEIKDADSLITVDFLDAGLTKLAANQEVVVSLTAKLKDLSDGQVVNSGRSIVRGPNVSKDSTPTTTPWDDVVTYLGKLRLKKLNGANNEVLKGAAFDLYRCTADGKLDGDALEKGVVSGQDGLVSFNKALHVTDYENDADVASVTKRYCAVETTAPQGFQLLRDPIVIDFKRADLTENDGNVAKVARTVDVPNYSRPVLPSTGGMGIIVVALAGLAIIGGGIVMARRNARKA